MTIARNVSWRNVVGCNHVHFSLKKFSVINVKFYFSNEVRITITVYAIGSTTFTLHPKTRKVEIYLIPPLAGCMRRSGRSAMMSCFMRARPMCSECPEISEAEMTRMRSCRTCVQGCMPDRGALVLIR